MAMTKTGKKTLWIVQFLAHLKYRLPSLPSQPVILKAENRGVILLIANPKFYHRIKNIERRHHLIQEKVESKKIIITHLSTKDMVTDRPTKELTLKSFQVFRVIIRMH